MCQELKTNNRFMKGFNFFSFTDSTMTTMKTIIRIEHPRDGKGLFSAQDEKGICYYQKIPLGRRIQSSFYFFPSPRQDNKIKRNPDSSEYCGFLTIADLNQHLKPE